MGSRADPLGWSAGPATDVGRFRYDPEAGARHPVGDNLGHRVIERLVDDLGSLLGRDGG